LQTARKLVDAHGADPGKLIPALAVHDEAVAVQVASLLADAGVSGAKIDLENASEAVRRGFEAVLGK